MSIPWLDEQDLIFPPLESALTEPNGLLAAGGDLSSERLLLAYKQGIFPWYEEGEPVYWWSPDPRSILEPQKIKISKSLAKSLKAEKFKVSCNLAFRKVIEGCAISRAYASGTWITHEMTKAYVILHDMGAAHSIDIWKDDELVGGLYGVAIGKVFFGESMFHKCSDASKVALATLCQILSDAGFPLIDCQVRSDHMDSMGAVDMDRKQFLSILSVHTESSPDDDLWSPRRLFNW